MDIIEQLKQDVARLALPQGRMVGTPGHDAARAYLCERLAALGLKGYNGDSVELPYAANGIQFTNLIAGRVGVNPHLPPILLAAHYDTCGPYPGADDNAAAIAILLALADQWRHAPLERTVLFAFFDAEEPPFFLSPAMGSVYFYHHQRTGPIHCAVVLDLVGHSVPVPGLEDVVFVTGMESNVSFAKMLQDCEGAAPIRIVPTLNRYVGDLSDHHAFRLDRRPYLFFSCAHWDHYHQPSDTPEKLNYPKIAALTQYLGEVVTRACADPLDAPFEGYDSTETELYFLRSVLGPLLDAMPVPLESRKDIERLVAVLTEQFGL